MELLVWWIVAACVAVVAEFVVVKIAVYAFYKARRLHEKDLERENDNGSQVKECKGKKRAGENLR